MRRKDITVGEEYACYGNGRADHHHAKRVRVLKLGVERSGRTYTPGCINGFPYTTKDGVEVRLLDNTGKPTCHDTNVVPTRDIQKLWTEYAPEQAERRAKLKERTKRKEHQLESARHAQNILHQHGVDTTVNQHRPGLVVEFDELHALAKLLDARC